MFTMHTKFTYDIDPWALHQKALKNDDIENNNHFFKHIIFMTNER